MTPSGCKGMQSYMQFKKCLNETSIYRYNVCLYVRWDKMNGWVIFGSAKEPTGISYVLLGGGLKLKWFKTFAIIAKLTYWIIL